MNTVSNESNASYIGENESLMFPAILITIALLGVFLCSLAAIMTFTTANIRKKFVLFGGLFLAEGFLATSRTAEHIYRIVYDMSLKEQPLVPAYRCLRQVHPLVQAVAFAVVPLPLCCIAAQVFMAVCFPLFYRSRVSKNLPWYEMTAIASFGAFYTVVVTVMFSTNYSRVRSNCVFFECLPEALTKGMPLTVNSLTCVFTVWTIISYKRNRAGAASSRFDARSRSSDIANQRRFVLWLYRIMIFTLMFNMLPMLTFSVLKFLKIRAVNISAKSIIVLSTLKAVVVPLTCLSFPEYRGMEVTWQRFFTKLLPVHISNVIHVSHVDHEMQTMQHCASSNGTTKTVTTKTH